MPCIATLMLPAAPAHATGDPSVSTWEYSHVHAGETKVRVERVFDTTGHRIRTWTLPDGSVRMWKNYPASREGQWIQVVYGRAPGSETFKLRSKARCGSYDTRCASVRWGAIGNSITYGTGTSDPNLEPYSPTYESPKAYPALAGIPGHGIPGESLVLPGCWLTCTPLVESFGDQLDAMIASGRVTHVVVEIGINDLSKHPTDDAMKDAYLQLVATGGDKGVHVVLSTLTPLGNSLPAVTQELQDQRVRINTWIRSQASFVDFAAAVGGDSWSETALAPDGLHPSDQGQIALGAALTKYMKEH